MQKVNEVEAEKIDEGTSEKGQDHDRGEKVNRCFGSFVWSVNKYKLS